MAGHSLPLVALLSLPIAVLSILAYSYYLGSGREEADAIGIATELVELAAGAI